MIHLRFLHMPKTAGTTFTSILTRQYGAEGKYDLIDNIEVVVGDLESLSEKDRAKITWFAGHAPLTIGTDLADTAKTITLLREPVSRVKSFCQHVSEGKSTYLVKDFPPESFQLDEFLESGILELSNLQTKMLINEGIDGGCPAQLDVLSDKEAENLAIDKLFNRVSHFGLQEFFDESLIVFRDALGWRLPLYARRNQRNPNQLIRFEDRHISKIKELNAIDLAVYRSAKERFLEVFDAVPLGRTKVGTLRSLNRLNKKARETKMFVKGLVKR